MYKLAYSRLYLHLRNIWCRIENSKESTWDQKKQVQNSEVLSTMPINESVIHEKFVKEQIEIQNQKEKFGWKIKWVVLVQTLIKVQLILFFKYFQSILLITFQPQLASFVFET